jgi:altered-inheritance-of-mitochondria protein 13
VVNHLSDRLDSPETTPERQSVLDAHIRGRIQGELERLRKDEEDIRHEIEQALEKENLDKERSVAGEESEGGASSGGLRSSTALLGDLEEMRSKIDKYNSRRDFSTFPEVKTTGEAVVECYRCFFTRFTIPLSDGSFLDKTRPPPSTAGRRLASSKPLSDN